MVGRLVSLAHLTLLDLAAPDLIDVAAEAGFDAVGLRISPAGADDHPWPLLAQASLRARVHDRLNATGLSVLDVEVLRLDGAAKPRALEAVIDVAAELGARYALVNAYDREPARLREHFHELCELSVPRGVRPVLEFLPYSDVRTLAAALEVVRGSRGGVLVDPLHLQRSGGSVCELAAVEPSLRPYLQLCDAPRAAPSLDPDVLRAESRHDRLAPGRGELDLHGLLDAYSPEVPLSIEVPSDAARAQRGARGWARALRKSVDALAGAPHNANAPRTHATGRTSKVS